MGALGDARAALRGDLEAIADPERAVGAQRYMRDQFPFLGIPMGELRRTARSLIAAGRSADAEELTTTAQALWTEPEREFHYVAVDLLRRWVDRLGADDLAGIEPLLRTRSWWDTADALAAHVVGGLVRSHPELGATMDEWIDDECLWIARSAILHQLRYGADTDVDRLFRYIDRRAGDREFFIRKASGWALREYAKTDAGAVRSFVSDRGDALSGLTRREALKNLAADTG